MVAAFARICVAILLVGNWVSLLVGNWVSAAAAGNPVLSPTPWAILRCYVSDMVPLSLPLPPAYANNPDAYFKDLFTDTGKGKGGLYDYWGQYSGHPDQLTGTTVYPWVSLGYTFKQFIDPTLPHIANWAEDCVQQYVNAGTIKAEQIGKYYGFIGILNAGDAFGAGDFILKVTSLGAQIRWTGFTTNELDPQVLAHEMGHGYGLQHTRCTSTGADYCDSSDVMGGSAGDAQSFINQQFALVVNGHGYGCAPPPPGQTGCGPPSAGQRNQGWSGPGLNAQHLSYLGWIPKTYVFNKSQPRRVNVTLAALPHWDTPGNVVYQVVVADELVPGGLTIEFRNPTKAAPNWDQNIPASVQIYTGESSQGGYTYLIDDYPGGPQFAPSALAGSDGLLVMPGFWNNRATIIGIASMARVPAIYAEREYADDGGLIAYGPNVLEHFRQAAGYVDRILRGAKPGDLPINASSKFDFVVNLRTARALGLTPSPDFLSAANEVIE